VNIFDLDHSQNVYWPEPGQPIRLPAGRYAIDSFILTPRAGQDPSISLIVHPELRLDDSMAQTLDARIGKAVSSASDNPAVRRGQQIVVALTTIRDCACVSSYGAGGCAVLPVLRRHRAGDDFLELCPRPGTPCHRAYS
jgi:hypothetical protein